MMHVSTFFNIVFEYMTLFDIQTANEGFTEKNVKIHHTEF
jgi:hypothetical protein